MLAIMFIEYSLMPYFMYYNNALTNAYIQRSFKTPCNFIAICVLCIIVIEHTIIVVTATRFVTSHYRVAEH